MGRIALALLALAGCGRAPLAVVADGGSPDFCGAWNEPCCRGADCAEGLICRRTNCPSGGCGPYCRMP
jgi:hypothetical protein